MSRQRICTLACVIAISVTLGAGPASAQEKRKTYTLPENFKGDPAGEASSATSVTKRVENTRATDSSGIAPLPDKAEITAVRLLSSPTYTRVILDLSRQVRYEAHRLPADPSKGLPPRIYIDIFGARLATDSKEPIKVDDSLLRQVRVGQFAPDTVRAVLDMTSVREHTVSQLQDPNRLVIDIQGQNRTDTLASVEPSKPAPSPMDSRPQKKPETLASVEQKKPAPAFPDRTARSNDETLNSFETARVSRPPVRENKPAVKEVKPPPIGIKKIVLDPGHGGRDPGAIGVDGVAEKDVVLKVAKKLAAKLKKELGAQVVLTRKDDRFVRLEDRTAIANAEDADLFISLHMNASSTGEAKGLETYYLDNTTDEASIRLAERENGTSRNKVSDLQFILSDMTQNMKLEDSVTLAHRLHESLLTSMSPKLGEVKDLGVKKALFYVLVGARMPSVLLEMFFITNKTEGRAMSQEASQDAVVDALYEGIKKYNESVLAAKTL